MPIIITMSTISEWELEDAGRNNAIKAMDIVQQKSKKFRILVQLTWKGGMFTLETQRKHAREWSSLDRLIKHIKEHYGNVTSITIHLST